MSTETLAVGAESVTFFSRSLRREGRTRPRAPLAYASDGAVYSYRKGPTTRDHLLAWYVSAAELASLTAFFAATAQGSRVPVLWIDADAEERTVRLIGGFTSRQVGPNRYLVEIPAEESL
jgi:hypothetical protein